MSNETGAARDLIELAGLAETCADLLGEAIDRLGSRVAETLERGGTLMFCGNGGSAADAQHLAAELVVRRADWQIVWA